MIRMINAPEKVCHELYKCLFLAGGITNCPDWQNDIYQMLVSRMPQGWCVLNPRRIYTFSDSATSREQIVWEFQALLHSDLILFWFPAESICPISLFELGRWSSMDVPLVVGVHPDYPRRFDVEVQMEQANIAFKENPIKLVYSLEDLASEIIEKSKLI